MRLLERAVSEHPIVVVVVFALITLALLPGLERFRIDVSAENFIPDSDVEQHNYKQFLDEFGRDDFLIVIIRLQEPFSENSLALLRTTGDRLKSLDGVSATFSMADAVKIDRTGLIPVARRLVPELPLDEQQRAELRSVIANHSLFQQKVVSPDGKVALLSVVLEREVEEDDRRRAEVIGEIRSVLDEELSERGYEMTGISFLKTEISRASKRDTTLLGPLAALVCLAGLWVAFRSFWAMFVSSVAALTALLWTMSLFFLAGLTLNMATTLVPTLVIAISLAQIIFIVAQYQRVSGDASERVKLALRRALPPLFLAALTTAAGFSSLAVTPVAPVREFGLTAALGIVFAFVIAVCLVPALIRLRPNAIPLHDSAPRSRWFGFLSNLTRHRGWIVTLTVLVVAVSAAGLLQVKIETSPYEFFSEDNPLNRARRLLREHIGSASSLEVMASRSDGGLFDGPALRELATLRERVRDLPLVSDTLSLVDLGELIAGDPAGLERLLSRELALTTPAAIRSIVTGHGLLERYLSADGRKTRMTIILREHNAERIRAALEEFETIAPVAAPGLEIVPTGQTVLFARMVEDLFFSQIFSVTLILAFVTVVFILAFRSLVVGLLSLIPNIAPIVIALGLMGWLGIPLNVLTIMVASIAIGIAVDDTIHLMQHLRLRLQEGCRYDDAIDDAINAKGRPILITALMLTVALLTLGISSFRPTVYLGVLTAVTMLAALVGDLVLLPAMLRFLRPKVWYKKSELIR